MAPILTFAMTAAITPGPNNIILSTNAVNFGFRKTIPLILGVFFGFLSVLSHFWVDFASILNLFYVLLGRLSRFSVNFGSILRPF